MTQTSAPGSARLSLPGSLVLVGAGRMGGAMLEGWIGLGLDPAGVAVVDPTPSDEARALLARHGVTLNPAPDADRPSAVVVMAVKPQMLDAALPRALRHTGRDTLVVSIMAGKTLATLAAGLPPETAIVRAMPNTPAAIGRGATVAVANGRVTSEHRIVAHNLLAATGHVEWVEDEGLIDAVTAVSGSGPAYVFLMVESLARAGVAAGLPTALAMTLARLTVTGAGELLHRSPLPPETLRANVTSPGGTTAAALEILMGSHRLDELLRDAVAAAARRSRELAG